MVKNKLFVILLLVICCMPLSRVLFDYWGWDYKIATLYTYIATSFGLLACNGFPKIKLHYSIIIFLLIFSIISFVHICIGKALIVQMLSSYIRFFVLSLTINYAIAFELDRKTMTSVAKILFAFFVYTFIFSLFQVFTGGPLNEFFSKLGGNSTSSTALKNIRVNGGIGGTVIAYAVLIVFFEFIFILYIDYFNQFEKITYLMMIIIVLFLNYSRAAFLGTIFAIFCLIILYIKSNNQFIKKIMVITAIVCGIVAYLVTDNILVRYIFHRDIYRIESDNIRLYAFRQGFLEMDSLDKLMFGLSVGQNTGFSSNGKILCDGTLSSVFLDYGLFGLLFFLILFFLSFWFILKNVDSKYKYLVVVFLMDLLALMIINSGFLENINILLFGYVVAGFQNYYLAKKNDRSS